MRPSEQQQCRAELFTWISEQPITRDQAMRCAKREPGRSWEAITSEIRRLSKPCTLTHCSPCSTLSINTLMTADTFLVKVYACMEVQDPLLLYAASQAPQQPPLLCLTPHSKRHYSSTGLQVSTPCHGRCL